jgi:hypothetical protein
MYVLRWRKWQWRRFFSEYFGFFPLPALLHTHLDLNITTSQKDKRVKPGNLPESNVLSQIEEDWRESYLNSVLAFKWLITYISEREIPNNPQILSLSQKDKVS